MKTVKKLIQLHKFLFGSAVLLTFVSVAMNLCWNQYLAAAIDRLGDDASMNVLVCFAAGIGIILFLGFFKFVSSYLASYVCELFAHEMRVGYARHYLQCDLRQLSLLNVGEEQSAMQNELKDITDYLHENLFSLMKQFGAFVVTVLFLLRQNFKLTLLSVLPVLPLILYCSCSSKVIKNYTEQCQSSKKKINGLADLILELFPVIKIYGANRLVRQTMNERLSEWGNVNIRKEKVSARLMSLSGVFSFIPQLILLGFGGAMVLNGEISLGTFYIFINLFGNVSGFLQNMPNVHARFRSFCASVGRLEGKIVMRED